MRNENEIRSSLTQNIFGECHFTNAGVVVAAYSSSVLKTDEKFSSFTINNR